MKYFAKIKFFGRDFNGFQVQPDKRTVQGELCRALSEAFGKKTSVCGCSRTDSGVHANEFCITLANDGGTIPAEKLPVAVAKFLPDDISLFYAKECDESFHPRYDAESKEYLYRIYNETVADPFEHGRSYFLPRKLTDSMIEIMRKCSEVLIGTHDFSAFMSSGSDASDTVRCIKYIEIERNGSIVSIRVCANGFLYNMVRIIVGTLIDAAFGRFSRSDFLNMLESKDRAMAGQTAPAEGLYLNKVNYKMEKIP